MLDLLVRADAVITMDPLRRVLTPGWVGIADGVIVSIGDGDPPPAADVLEPDGGVLMPGLVSAHHHSMDRLAPLAFPESFPAWLFGVYYGHVTSLDPAGAARSATLTAADAQHAGITTFCDNWGVGSNGGRDRVRAAHAATVAAYQAAGQRVLLAEMVGDRLPDGWVGLAAAHGLDASVLISDTATVLADLEASTGLLPRGSLVTACPAPELPELATPELLRGVRAIAERAGVPWCTHLAASAASAALCPLPTLDAHGFLGPGLVGAHARFVDADDIGLLAARGVAIATCPSASLALGGGVAALMDLRSAGVTVGVGADNPSLNPTVDLLGEARLAGRLSRSRTGDPTNISDDDLLALVTLDGAGALGMSDLIGSLEVGKRADLVVFDRAGATPWLPSAPAASWIARRATPRDVRHLVIDGRIVLQDNRLQWMKGLS